MIKIVLAANATESSGQEIRSTVDSETKNKRQVNQYLRTPGTSAITSIGTDSGPQVFPLYSQGLYSQKRVPLYTRRPTTITRAQADEDEEEQEPQQQQQVRCFIRIQFKEITFQIIKKNRDVSQDIYLKKRQ